MIKYVYIKDNIINAISEVRLNCHDFDTEIVYESENDYITLDYVNEEIVEITEFPYDL